MSLAQTLEDRVKFFEEAKKNMDDEKGCLSIPYPTRQSDCKSNQQDVDKWCKQSGPWNCDDVDPKVFQKQLENLKTRRDELASKLTDLKRNEKENAEKIKQTESDIREVVAQQEPLKSKIKQATKDIIDRTDLGRRCLSARSAVHNVFDATKREAAGESDVRIVPLARDLIAWWESREGTHKKAIVDAGTAVVKCEKTLSDVTYLGNFN